MTHYSQEECPHHLSWQTWGSCDGCGRADSNWQAIYGVRTMTHSERQLSCLIDVVIVLFALAIILGLKGIVG